MKFFKNLYFGSRLLKDKFISGLFCFGYHNEETERCFYVHLIPQREYWIWGRHREKDIFYDCVFYKGYYLGPFLTISWSSYYE